MEKNLPILELTSKCSFTHEQIRTDSTEAVKKTLMQLKTDMQSYVQHTTRLKSAVILTITDCGEWRYWMG